jgi:hypothetical protein
MTRIVSIDPGVHEIGFALWQDDVLWNAGMLPSPFDNPEAWRAKNVWTVDTIVIERPQVYERPLKTKNGRVVDIDKNDLITLALVAGEVAGATRSTCNAAVVYTRPAAWKGALPKGLMKNRMLKRLSSIEQQRVSLPIAVSKQHNVWDAIGIGMHHLGRYPQGPQPEEEGKHNESEGRPALEEPHRRPRSPRRTTGAVRDPDRARSRQGRDPSG